MKEANILFIDSPVGSGYSYVEDLSLLTTDIGQITDDLVQLIKQFMIRHAEFKVIRIDCIRLGSFYASAAYVAPGIMFLPCLSRLLPVPSSVPCHHYFFRFARILNGFR